MHQNLILETFIHRKTEISDQSILNKKTLMCSTVSNLTRRRKKHPLTEQHSASGSRVILGVLIQDHLYTCFTLELNY
jgi:hypothetical protein